MQKIILLVLAFLFFSSPAIGCDKVKAKSIIDAIVDGGAASREDGGITIWYTWNGWYSMSKDQQYAIAKGLGDVERCLKPPVTVRIRAAGKDVARSRTSGTEILGN